MPHNHLIDTKLKPDYYDIEERMLHGMFALLDSYVEEHHDGIEALEAFAKELLYSSDGMGAHYNHRQGEREMEACVLYRWWHETWPVDLQKQIDMELSTDINNEEYDNLVERRETEETEMMIRLVKLRGSLWT